MSDFFLFSASNFAFSPIFYEILSGFRDKFQKRVTCVAFSLKFADANSNIAEKKKKMPEVLKSVKIS